MLADLQVLSHMIKHAAAKLWKLADQHTKARHTLLWWRKCRDQEPLASALANATATLNAEGQGAEGPSCDSDLSALELPLSNCRQD